jgi:hypothetical protein
MDPHSLTINMLLLPSPFDQLADVLREQGVIVSELPPEVFGYRLKPETWLEEGDDALTIRAANSLPAEVSGARIDGTPVLFCILTGDATYEGMSDNLRRLRNQATIARSWLETDAPNLQMFVSVPPDGASPSAWLEYAGVIEADDRICRKLVWLPADEGTGETAEEFLSRTFLASPWIAGANSQPLELDSMSSIDLPPGWSSLIGDEELDSADLVRRLAGLNES